MGPAMTLNPTATSGSGSSFSTYDIFSDEDEKLTEANPEVKGLLSSLLLAHKCKALLKNRRNDEALVVFVKACVASVVCLDDFEDMGDKLLTLLNIMEHRQMKMGSQGLPHIHKAAKLILIGFRVIPAPGDDEETYRLVTNPGFFHEEFQMHMLLHNLKRQDMGWIMALSSFKVTYQMALDHRARGGPLETLTAYMEVAGQHCQNLSWRPSHPATLQAVAQLQMLVEDYQIAQEFLLHDPDPDPMKMHQGYDAAMKTYGDPAAAMHHLLQSMYINIQICHAKPNPQMQTLLMWASDKILELIESFQQTWQMWKFVKDKLLASMLLLGHAFPLAQILDNHPLVAFINNQHRIQRELLTQPALQLALREEDDLLDSDSDTTSPAKQSSRDQDEEGMPPDLCCARCNRHVAKQPDKVICLQCQATFYCSANCQKKHAQIHKGNCKRAKLKSKLVSKVSGR